MRDETFGAAIHDVAETFQREASVRAVFGEAIQIGTRRDRLHRHSGRARSGRGTSDARVSSKACFRHCNDTVSVELEVHSPSGGR